MQIAKFKEKSLLFTLLLTLAVFAPLLRIQIITGTVVNAMLFLAVLYLGLRAALIISLVPSLIALAVGLLPWAMAPLVPLIMLSNCLLAVVFYLLRQQPYLLKAILASIAKFTFLFTLAFVVSFYLYKELAVQVSVIFGFMQLVTALFGSALAYIVFRLKPNL